MFLKYKGKNVFIKRDEFARMCWFYAIGSARNYFRIPDLSEFELDIPSIEIQKKYVAIYEALQSNLYSFVNGIEDLKLVCDSFIEKLMKELQAEEIGKYIQRTNEKNSDGNVCKVLGLSTQKEWREPNSRVNKNELKGYKIVHKNDFAYVPTTDTWKVLAFSYNYFDEDIVVSPIYETFSVDLKYILPEYLSIFLSRKEFDRYARYHSWGSARENFTFGDMCHIALPIPSIEIQNSIIRIRKVLKDRKRYSAELRTILTDICPILLCGSILEAKGGATNAD